MSYFQIITAPVQWSASSIIVLGNIKKQPNIGSTLLSTTYFTMNPSDSPASSFDYDSLGDIPLFYIPEPPAPVLTLDRVLKSRWSVDIADLPNMGRVNNQSSRTRPNSHFSRPSLSLPSPVTMETKSHTLVYHLWIFIWTLVQRLWSYLYL